MKFIRVIKSICRHIVVYSVEQLWEGGEKTAEKICCVYTSRRIAFCCIAAPAASILLHPLEETEEPGEN